MEEAKKYIDDLLTTIARDQNYKNCVKTVKQIENGDDNNSNYIFLVTVSSVGKTDLKLFAKVSSTEGQIRSNMEILYRNESFFYNTFLKSYRDLEERHSIPEEHRIRTPQFYGCSTKQHLEVLVLEDLSAKGFRYFDKFKCVSWYQTADSLGQLAKIHALSFALLNEKPMIFENVKKKITYATDSFETIVRGCLPKIIEATDDKNKKRIATFVRNNLNSEKFSTIFKPMTKEVIIHGDYRPNNLMYKTENGKCQVVSLNPQTIRCGSLVYDLLYFIDCSFHTEFREKYYQAAIDHYYSELRLALQRFKLNPDEVYSRKDFDFELKEILPYTVTLGLCLLLILATDEDTAQKEFEKHEKYPNLFAINEHFKKKLNEYIQFYSKMGVIP